MDIFRTRICLSYSEIINRNSWITQRFFSYLLYGAEDMINEDGDEDDYPKKFRKSV